MRISDWSSDVCSSDLGQGEAVEAGQVEVEQGKVEAAGGGFGKRGQAVRGVDDCVALGAQQAGDHFGHGGVVLDQQQLQGAGDGRSEEHTSELQSLMRISYAVFCLTKKRHS